MSETAIISIVDDDESVRMALDGLLRSNGYTVHAYANAEAFLSSSGPWITACLISDIQMPGLSGLQMHQALSAMGVQVPIIFITGNPDAPARLNAKAMAPIAFFPKPFHCGELIACIEAVLNRPA